MLTSQITGKHTCQSIPDITGQLPTFDQLKETITGLGRNNGISPEKRPYILRLNKVVTTWRKTGDNRKSGFHPKYFTSVRLEGRVIYACNRLHHRIGFFSIGETGGLSFVTDKWTRGNYPRSFNFDPTGKFLYSCNQRGDNIAAFKVDQKSGTLKFTEHYTPVGTPSIIVFLDLAR